MTRRTTASRLPLLLFAAAVGLASPALAQQPGKFSLPAGVHSHRALADLLEQVERAPLRQHLARPDATVSLQRHSHLRGPQMARLLRVVLEEQGALRARVASETTPSFDPVVEVSALRPFVAAPDTGHVLRTVPLDDAIELRGSAAQVRFAARLLDLAAGAAPTAEPSFACSDRVMNWPGGKIAARSFVQHFAVALDAMVLGEVPDRVVDLGEPARLAQRDWLARASAALFEAGVWLAPRLPEQRLFVVRDADSRAAAALLRCAEHAGNEEVLTRTDAMPVATVVELDHAAAIDGMQQLMPSLRRTRTTAVGMLDARRILICGARPEVADVVATLRAFDER